MFSSSLLKAWDEWDVRVMVLLSLYLQVILSILGNRRIYGLNFCFTGFLWLAYSSADWIAIATLGKLSSSCVGSASTSNVLRALWAPLLLVHLGGSDTITAYAYEDNKLWVRHLLILVAKTILVVYVICVSWTASWISFVSLLLILAGMTKYIERILCLWLNNSQETHPIISISPQHPFFNHPLLEKLPDRLGGFLLFTFMRPDVNDYLSTLSNPNSARIKIKKYLQKSSASIDSSMLNLFSSGDDESFDFLNMVAYEMRFIFDNVYTKAPLICTTYGWLLRLTRFACFFSVLLLLLIGIMDGPKFHFSRVDICITYILLGGAILLELYAAWVMLLSDWAILVGIFHHNVLIRKMFWFLLNLFPKLLFRRKKTWSHAMGQFDLLAYCLRCKKKGANEKSGILQKNIEQWQILKSIILVNVPFYLRSFNSYRNLWDLSFSEYAFKGSRGQRALKVFNQYDSLKWSIEIDFDYGIMIWHLATKSVYLLEDRGVLIEARQVSMYVSDYMMYLLVTRPNLLLHEHSKSFWLDLAYDQLKELMFSATDIRNAASTLVSVIVHHEEELESSESGQQEHVSSDTKLENLQENVSKLALHLNQLENKWEMIKEVWMEMLFYAACSSQQISHVKQLGEEIELLSLLWLSGGIALLKKMDEAT